MPEHAQQTHGGPGNAKNPRSVAVVTTGRADYGILNPVLAALDANPGTLPSVYATGAHLSERHGMTIRGIRSDGWPVAAEIPTEPGLSEPDQECPTPPMAAGLAHAAAGFADAFSERHPDICLLLGDRFETLAAATAAAASGVPIAHIHGGEITLGALDNQFRFAITALANLHCAATDLSRRRLIAMGEPEPSVILTGAPGLDLLTGFEPMDSDAFCREVGLSTAEPFLLVTLHPTTISDADSVEETNHLVNALHTIAMPCLITAANQDDGGDAINAALADACHAHGWTFVQALGPVLYRNAMAHAAVMVGNSSSGIIEAASMALPVVNVGDRQLGRERSGNVIDCGHCDTEITDAVRRALDMRGRGFDNIYGDGRASPRIAEAVATMPLGRTALRKPFEPPGLGA